jgi:hypothetical protein
VQAVLYFNPHDLQYVFDKYSLDDFEIEEGGQDLFLKKVNNFFRSNHNEELIVVKLLLIGCLSQF